MYPVGVRIFIDGKDVSSWVFSDSSVDPSRERFSWKNVDITQFVRTKGVHTIEITAEEGVGRVELITEIS